LRPILEDEEYYETEKSVIEFLKPGKGGGYYLQSLLKQKSLVSDNWAYDWYVNDYYLKVRLPLPIYSNPSKIMPKQIFVDENDYLGYVTHLIRATLDFKSKIDK
jgi:choline O-acetyltransferase